MRPAFIQRELAAMEKRIVTASETEPVVLDRRGGGRGVTEPGMLFEVRRPSLIDIAPCRCESVVIALLGYSIKVRGWRRFNNYRLWMRTCGQKEREKQGRQNKRFLHIESSRSSSLMLPRL